MKTTFKIVAFDADDTLWVNEPFYRETERKFFALLADFASEKVLAEADYQKLMTMLGIEPEDFLMIGNSRKSDIIPVVNLGGYAIYFPYHTSWQLEESEKIESNRCIEAGKINDILEILT